jgi:integrase
MTRTYERRLGPHHFAYLRSLAEGLDREDAARRYLGMAHGHELVTLHRQLVDQLRALARRAGDSRWRLIGIDLGARSSTEQGGVDGATPRPALYEWAEAEGLGDWSQDELLEMYEQRFPTEDPRAARKARRNGRLRERQLEVLAELAKLASQPALATDRIDAWFDPATAERLMSAGCLLLQDLAQRIADRKTWWSGIRAVGAAKAARIEAHLQALLPTAKAVRGLTTAPAEGAPMLLPRSAHALDGSQGSNRSPLPPRVPAGNDLEAIDAWLASAVGKPGEPGHNAITESTYRREAERWLMFCLIERRKAMSSADSEDCRAYMSFLNGVPAHWMSRRKAARLDVTGGWTPFRGQPGLASRRLAVKVIHLMCNWLTAQRYLDSNPWTAVNRGLVDGNEVAPAPTSRALTPAAYQALLSALPCPERPGETRNGFVVTFTRFTGLRATELLNAKVGDLKPQDFGWQLDVVGKGRKRRLVSVPSPALEVLEQYLTARGLPPLSDCEPSAPLLAAQDDGRRAPTYSAVHQSLSTFLRRAIRHADLPEREREQALRATQHWLRHTFATRAAEAGVPEDVLMAEMGHASRATTAGYYTAQDRRRHEAMERAAGSSR